MKRQGLSQKVAMFMQCAWLLDIQFSLYASSYFLTISKLFKKNNLDSSYFYKLAKGISTLNPLNLSKRVGEQPWM